MTLQTNASTATLTDILHEAHTMRDEALASLVVSAWHGISQGFRRLVQPRIHARTPAHLAK